MNVGSRPGRRVILGTASAAGALFLGVLLLGSAIAPAAQPAKGKAYSGQVNFVVGGMVVNTYPISFKVSGNGKKVGQFSLPEGYPIYCEGGGFGTAQKATAKITSNGTFRAKLPILFEPTNQDQGFVEISGKFGAKKHESGTVTTDFTKSSTCNGASKYKTQAK